MTSPKPNMPGDNAGPKNSPAAEAPERPRSTIHGGKENQDVQTETPVTCERGTESIRRSVRVHAVIAAMGRHPSGKILGSPLTD
jgi:hypothetical protein